MTHEFSTRKPEAVERKPSLQELFTALRQKINMLDSYWQKHLNEDEDDKDEIDKKITELTPRIRLDYEAIDKEVRRLGDNQSTDRTLTLLDSQQELFDDLIRCEAMLRML